MSHAATADGYGGAEVGGRSLRTWLVGLLLVTTVGAGVISGSPSSAAGGAEALPPEAAPYIDIYKAAAEHWKVNWYLLASIHMQESNFGTLRAPGVTSGVNAFGCCAGPMQFNVKDPTWDGHKNAYREIAGARPASYPLRQTVHPSPYDSFDAIAAAAHKLAADGATPDLYSDGSHEATCRYVGACSEVDNCGGPSEYCQVLPRAKTWERDGRTSAGSAGPVAGPSGWPLAVKGKFESPFGMRWGRPHRGIDLSAPAGTPIRSIAAGRVSLRQTVSQSGGYGNYVCVDHGEYESCYAHMLRPPPVALGQQVGPGQEIGELGSTGNSTGPHLHFEIRMPGHGAALCPAPYLDVDRSTWCQTDSFRA